MRIAILALLLASLTTQACCEEDVATFLHYYDAGTPESQHLLRRVLTATAVGIGWANMLEKKSPLYCKPDSVSLDDQKVLSLLRKAVANSTFIGSSLMDWRSYLHSANHFPAHLQ